MGGGQVAAAVAVEAADLPGVLGKFPPHEVQQRVGRGALAVQLQVEQGHQGEQPAHRSPPVAHRPLALLHRRRPPGPGRRGEQRQPVQQHRADRSPARLGGAVEQQQLVDRLLHAQQVRLAGQVAVQLPRPQQTVQVRLGLVAPRSQAALDLLLDPPGHLAAAAPATVDPAHQLQQGRFQVHEKAVPGHLCAAPDCAPAVDHSRFRSPKNRRRFMAGQDLPVPGAETALKTALDCHKKPANTALAGSECCLFPPPAIPPAATGSVAARRKNESATPHYSGFRAHPCPGSDEVKPTSSGWGKRRSPFPQGCGEELLRRLPTRLSQ